MELHIQRECQVLSLTTSDERREYERVIAGLNETPRRGWVIRGVKNPETNLAHTRSMRDMAVDMNVQLRQSGISVHRVEELILVHEWGEDIIGDWITATLLPDERERMVRLKGDVEARAVRYICGGFGRHKERLFSLWNEYNAGNTREAAFAKELDKVQAICQAREYEKLGDNSVRTAEFIGTSRGKIKHPLLLKIVKDIEQVGT